MWKVLNNDERKRFSRQKRRDFVEVVFALQKQESEQYIEEVRAEKLVPDRTSGKFLAQRLEYCGTCSSELGSRLYAAHERRK